MKDEPVSRTSNPKLALSARLLKHAHAPVFRSTVFPVLAELKQDLIDAAAELERQRREVEHLTQMLGRPSDETKLNCPTCDGTGEVGIPGGPCPICRGKGKLP